MQSIFCDKLIVSGLLKCCFIRVHSRKLSCMGKLAIKRIFRMLHLNPIHANKIRFLKHGSRGSLRPVSTQENKHRIGLFFILYYPHRWMKKVENTTTLYHRIIGSNWNRKLVPKAHARFQSCSDPVRSHAYFPEWKPAFSEISVGAWKCKACEFSFEISFLSFEACT